MNIKVMTYKMSAIFQNGRHPEGKSP